MRRRYHFEGFMPQWPADFDYCVTEVVNKDTFKEGVVSVLQAIADKLGEGRYDEPKHNIKGDDLGNEIQALRSVVII